MIGALKEEYENKIFDLEIKDEFIHIQNVEGCTDKDLLRLSAEMSDVLISAEILVDTNFNERWYTVNYKDGNKYLIRVDIAYTIFVTGDNEDYILKLFNKNRKLWTKVQNTLNDFYKKIDTVTRDEMGEFVISDNADKEIIIKMNIDNYFMIASKKGSAITITEFEKLG